MRIAPRLRRAMLIVLLAALAALALWPESRRVDTAIATSGPVRETVEAEGRTRIDDRYLIASPIVGNARRLKLEPGDVVHVGDVLVEIDPLASSALDPRSRAEAQARLAAARAQAQAASAARDAADNAAAQAKRDAERLQSLHAQGLLAAEPAEQARSLQQQREREAASARFQAQAANHEAELAAASLASFSGGESEPWPLRSPVDGVLLRRHFESATPVNVGTPLVEVGAPASMEVEVDVLSADAVRMREGTPVELVRWGEPELLAGRVRRIEPAAFTKISALGVEEQRVWVRVSFDAPQERWARLGDAYRVTARFLLASADASVRIPASALFRHESGWAVFRIEGGRARQQAVEVGVQGEGWAEIRNGLEVGARVIVHPERSLEDGARVTERD